MAWEFAVINFWRTNEVAVVPVSWLFEDKCYWPPKNMAAKIIPLIEKRISPSEIWDMHEINIIGLFETYDDARKKLSKAEDGSDLNATDPENLGKGKRFRKRKHFSTSSQSDEEIFVIPDPPQLQIFKENRPVIETVAAKTHSDDIFTLSTLNELQHVEMHIDYDDDTFTLSTQKEIEHSDSQNKQSPSLLKEINSNCSINKTTGSPSQSLLRGSNPGCSGYSTKTKNSPSSSQLRGMNPGCSGLNKTKTSSPFATSQNSPQVVKNSTTNFEERAEAYFKEIIRSMRVIKMKQKHLEDSVDSIMNLLNGSQERNFDAKNSNPEFLGIIKLIPLNNDEDLNIMNNQLSKDNFAKQMISYLQRVGGATYEQGLKLCLRRLLSDKVAQNFSYLGQRGKMPFKNTNICKVIQEAVKTNSLFTEVTDADIGKVISNWLRHAKARDQQRKGNLL